MIFINLLQITCMQYVIFAMPYVTSMPGAISAGNASAVVDFWCEFFERAHLDTEEAVLNGGEWEVEEPPSR